MKLYFDLMDAFWTLVGTLVYSTIFLIVRIILALKDKP